MNDKTELVKEAKNDKASCCCWSAYQKKIRQNGISRNAIRRNAIRRNAIQPKDPNAIAPVFFFMVLLTVRAHGHPLKSRLGLISVPGHGPIF